MFMWEAEANRQALSTKRHNFLLGNLQLFFLLLRTQLGTVINNPLLHSEYQPFHGSNNRLRKPSEEIAFTARPKINCQSLIVRYDRSIFCLPHWPKFSDVSNPWFRISYLFSDLFFVSYLPNFNSLFHFVMLDLVFKRVLPRKNKPERVFGL